MWQIAFHFGEIGMRQTLLLADWLMDLTFPSVKSSGSGHGVSSALAALSNAFPFGTIQLSKTATFGLRKATPSNGYAGSRFENVFQFDDEAQQIQIGPKDARLLARRLNFYWLQSPSDDGPIGQANAIALATIRANVGSGPVTVVRTIGSLDVAGDITIGKTAKSTTLKVTGAISRNAVFVYAGKSKATYRLAAAFSLEGQLMFLPKSGEDKALWPELPLASAFYRIAFEGDKQSTALIGDAPDKATLIASGHVHLTVSKRGDHEVASTEGGKVKAFRYSAVLHNAYVPLHHADYSRFDFRDTCVQFSLQEHADHEPHKTADFVYILGDAPVFGGMLDRRSVLRVHRASDLLDLKFGFRRLYLESRPDEAEIEDCTKKIASVAVVNADDPLLVVHFPPQHIAEKAFLRVGAECNVPKEENRVPLDKHRIYQNSDQADFAETLKFPETNLKANQQQARKERDKDHDVSIHEMNEIFDHLVEARAAGETRIVFEFPRNENCSADCVSVRGAEPVLPLAFSLDALTQWSRLRTKVATRALGRNVALKAQLDVAGIEPTTPLVGKMAAIRASLARHGAPTDDETSIEFPYRLQLSPSADARWITSPSPDHEAIERGVPLFRARLDPVYGGRDVRAIWSPDFAANYETFFHDDVSERKHPQHSNLAPWLPAGKYWRQFQIGPFVKWRRSYAYPFRMSQDARDRYELVMLSSVYGLPSLLPVPAADLSDPLTPKKLDNDQKSGDPSILPLPSAYTTAIGPYGREGVYSPRPLQRIDITLGSLGANVDLEGQWDPPSGFLSDAYHSTPLWPALTVERWKHRAFQGRDLQVEIVYKGFVLPFGHRCSVIKATERKFYADPAQPNGTSVAYLTQRFFILVGRPVKSFPALGQPFGGRALPYTGVRIVTTRSPDIADPFANDFKTEYPNAVPRAEKLGASAFIPTGANGQWIQFEYVLQYPDGSESDRMAMPFVVADNTLVHDPIAVSELIAFYNKESGSGTTGPYLQPEARTATARGQRLRYAPSRDTGDTEFRTESWLFGVHSRDIGTDTGSPPQRAFVMDATMEGADQPPFYPAIATANVEIQSLNTMNGKSSGFTRVSHDRHFLEHGFTPGRNDAEMYLAVLGNTHLALQDRANASGAIATPNNKVVSVSRLRGPVGGSAEKIATTRETLVTIPLRSTAVATAQAKGAVPLTSSTTAFEYQLPASHQNKFDPLEFFGKALSQAKLFGIVPLKDVVRALSFVDGAPEMLERITYTLFDFTEQAKSTAIGVVSRLRVSMESGLSATEDQIKLYGTSISPTLELTGNDLYPGLFGALRRLIADLATLEATILSFDASQPAEAQNRDAVVADTGAVAKASRDFVAEIEKVADQPTPAIVHNLVGAIQDGIKGLAAEVKSVVEDLKTELAAEIQAFFTVELCIQEDAKPIEIVENLAEEFSVISPVFGFFWENFVPPAPNNGQSCVTINLLDGESRRRAQNALYYETVGKPILDGSAALESLKDKLTEGALAIDTAVKELPRQILSAAQNWLDGMLSLHRLLGLADKLKATGTENLWDKVIVPVLKGGLLPFIDPLLKKTEEIATRAERINTQLLKLVEQAAKLLKGNKLPPAYLPRIQQVSSTLAKAQKALAAA
ncbi:hypothetical protein, partial [Pseudorhodoplanes sp.]|uniref:hypothetical protein n=1 Tax=Pseudorhodoplanes sp. TaxID=1934341 RepID=UPI003D122396